VIPARIQGNFGGARAAQCTRTWHPEHRCIRVQVLRALAGGIGGVNDPSGRAWGEEPRAEGGSFTPPMPCRPTLDGRQNAPPFQGAAMTGNAAQTLVPVTVPRAAFSANARHSTLLNTAMAGGKQVEDTPLSHLP
jgi:hypothetical protein